MKFKDFWNLFHPQEHYRSVFFPRTQHSVVVSSFQSVPLPDFSWTVTLGPLIYKWAFLHWGQAAELLWAAFFFFFVRERSGLFYNWMSLHSFSDSHERRFTSCGAHHTSEPHCGISLVHCLIRRPSGEHLMALTRIALHCSCVCALMSGSILRCTWMGTHMYTCCSLCPTASLSPGSFRYNAIVNEFSCCKSRGSRSDFLIILITHRIHAFFLPPIFFKTRFQIRVVNLWHRAAKMIWLRRLVTSAPAFVLTRLHTPNRKLLFTVPALVSVAFCALSKARWEFICRENLFLPSPCPPHASHVLPSPPHTEPRGYSSFL